MQAEDVISFLTLLEREGFVYWISGGWGVDALLGRQTRAHQDLDIAVDKRQLHALIGCLHEQGYRVTIDWFPVRLEMTSREGLRVDLHPLEIAADGSARQAGLDNTWFDYPAENFTTGRIGEKDVPCIDKALQITFHEGYPPREIDLQDLATLRSLPDTP